VGGSPASLDALPVPAARPFSHTNKTLMCDVVDLPSVAFRISTFARMSAVGAIHADGDIAEVHGLDGGAAHGNLHDIGLVLEARVEWL